VTDWHWDYLTDAEHVIGGLGPQHVDRVERVAQRLADAAGVKYLGDPPIEESGVSNVFDISEGPLMIWYQEHWRHHAVYILRVIDVSA
jgi:hypothetical protein